MTIPKAMIEPPPRKDLLRQNLRTLFSSDNSKLDHGDDQEQAEDYLHRRRPNNDEECSSSSYFPSPKSTDLPWNHSYYSYPNSTTSSPYLAPSPLTQQSPYQKSPWVYYSNDAGDNSYGLIGSLYREEGHICSIASSGGLLYTGSDGRNVRVWRNMQEFSGFKSSSGLVKAIVVLGDRIFTGHQDGKIRIWRARRGGGGDNCRYTRVGALPTTRDVLMKSVNPNNYVEVRRKKRVPWIRHYDAVSCLCVDEERGLLYSGSWDKTLKVWRISDFKCLESIRAHDDAVNAVAVGPGGFVFTGSADGTVKSWRRELVGRSPRHMLVEALLSGDHAVTSLAADSSCGSILYAGSSDGSVNFWTARDKHSLMSYGGALRGHKLAVLCLAVAGHKLVMSGSADSSICVWRWDAAAEAHSFVAVMTGHGGPVKCLAVEDDVAAGEEEGKKENWVVYSGSLDKSVKVWRVSDHVQSLPEMGGVGG